MPGRIVIKKRSKYGNRKTVVDGLTFDSKKEARRWSELRIMEAAGEITGLLRQVHYPIVVGNTVVCTYVGDFDYMLRGRRVIEDCKGFATAVYKLKKKLLWAAMRLRITEI